MSNMHIAACLVYSLTTTTHIQTTFSNIEDQSFVHLFASFPHLLKKLAVHVGLQSLKPAHVSTTEGQGTPSEFCHVRVLSFESGIGPIDETNQIFAFRTYAEEFVPVFPWLNLSHPGQVHSLECPDISSAQNSLQQAV